MISLAYSCSSCEFVICFAFSFSLFVSSSNFENLKAIDRVGEKISDVKNLAGNTYNHHVITMMITLFSGGDVTYEIGKKMFAIYMVYIDRLNYIILSKLFYFSL